MEEYCFALFMLMWFVDDVVMNQEITLIDMRFDQGCVDVYSLIYIMVGLACTRLVCRIDLILASQSVSIIGE